MGGACTALRDRAADAFGSPKRGHAVPPENLSSEESPRAEARAEGGAPRAALFAPPPTPVTSSAENSLSVSASGGLLLPTAAAAAKKGEESSVGEAAAHAPVVFKGAGVPVKVGEESVEGAADKEAAEDSFSGDTHPLAHGDDDDDDVTGTWYESGEEGDDASKAGGGGPSAGPAPSHLVTSHARPFDADAPPAAAAARLVHSRVEAFRRPAEPASPPPVPPPPKPTFEHSPSSLSALQSAKKHGTWPPPPPPPPHPGLVPQPASGAFGSPVDASTVPAAPPSGDAEENYVTPAPSVPSSVAGSSDHRASGGSSDSSPAAAKVKMSSSDIATAAAAAVASGLPGSTLLRGEPLGGSDAARSLALEMAHGALPDARTAEHFAAEARKSTVSRAEAAAAQAQREAGCGFVPEPLQPFSPEVFHDGPTGGHRLDRRLSAGSIKSLGGGGGASSGKVAKLSGGESV